MLAITSEVMIEVPMSLERARGPEHEACAGCVGSTREKHGDTEGQSMACMVRAD